MYNLKDVVVYLNDVIDSFDRDPADSDYQEGYLAMAKEARAVVVKAIEMENANVVAA